MVALTTPWSFWYHSMSDKDWSRESYKFVHKVFTAEELWGVFSLLTTSHTEQGIIFTMRNDIFPDWSDPHIRKGGCWSVKVPKDKVRDVWCKWLSFAVAESVSRNKIVCDEIIGLSISPKKTHYIIKLWTMSEGGTEPSNLMSDLPYLKGCKFTRFENKNA